MIPAWSSPNSSSRLEHIIPFDSNAAQFVINAMAPAVPSGSGSTATWSVSSEKDRPANASDR